MKVFLSHSSEDAESARRIAAHLVKEGFEVWNAEEEIQPGDNWAEVLGEALESSDAMVVLLSPAAVRSSWVQRDIDYALQSRDCAHRLIPVLVEQTADVPWILRRMQWIDLQPEPVEGLKRIVDVLRSVPAA